MPFLLKLSYFQYSVHNEVIDIDVLHSTYVVALTDDTIIDDNFLWLIFQSVRNVESVTLSKTILLSRHILDALLIEFTFYRFLFRIFFCFVLLFMRQKKKEDILSNV